MRDGHVAILPYTPAHWLRLLEAIGLGDVAARHALHDRGALNRAVRELYAELERATPSRTVAEWLRLCEALDIPAAPISALDDLPAHPHLTAVGMFETLEHPSRCANRRRAWASTRVRSATSPRPSNR